MKTTRLAAVTHNKEVKNKTLDTYHAARWDTAHVSSENVFHKGDKKEIHFQKMSACLEMPLLF